MNGAVQYIEIPAKDLDRDSSFYEQAFGWKFQVEGGYAHWSDPAGSMTGGMYAEITPAPEGAGPRVYITVDDIDAALARIESSGGSPTATKTLINEQIGWWAGFRDPAGNAMYLYQASHMQKHE